MKEPIVVISGGGTGGHIYPGLAIAQSLVALCPNLKVHFVGSPLGLETQIVPQYGFKLHLIRVGKLNYSGGILGKLRTLVQIPKALVESLFLLFELRPLFVLGVGGYASGPFVLMASLLGFKTAIWEPNAHPGLTNRWLSRFVGKSFVAFDEAGEYLKSREIIPSGIPVRRTIKQSQVSSSQPHSKFRVLVFGGSQGSMAINQAVSDLFSTVSPNLSNVELTHQTGSHDYKNIKSKYEAGGSQATILEYLHDIEKYYDWADLIICRAGAATLAEIAACRKPAILIPLPSSADDHQRINAEALVKAGAAQMILQKDLTPLLLEKHILELKSDPELGRQMSEKLIKFHRPQAAELVSQAIIESTGL